MRTAESRTRNDWDVGVEVWLERAGKTVLGPRQVTFLEAIQRCHSISAAARDLGVSYRHAWLLVQDINEAAGELLVEAAIGGRHDGGAFLTPAGRHALVVYQQLQVELDQAAPLLLPVQQQANAKAARQQKCSGEASVHQGVEG